MTLLFAGIALNVAEVLGFVFFLFNNLGSFDSGGWMVSLLTSVTLFRVLSLRLISGKRVIRLSFFPVLGSLIAVLQLDVLLVLLGQWTIAFWASEIDFLNIKG